MSNRILRSIKWRLNDAWKAKAIVSRLRAPVATFTFDDFPRSAWLTGGEILEAHGVRGTYFVAGAFDPENIAGTDTVPGIEYFRVEDVRAAHANGHEIGCHTFDHVDLPTQTTPRILDNIQRNGRYLRAIVGDAAVTSFAYPRGETDIRAKYLLGRHFAVCRGTWPGVNAGLVDLSQLRCYSLDAQFQRFSLDTIIAQARNANGWIVFNSHDVSASPSPYGCTPQTLKTVLARLQDAGIEVLPMKHALARVAFAP